MTTRIISLVTILVFAAIAVTPQISTQTQTPVEVGKVNEKVIVQSNRDQSYAVYLPKAYSPDRRWPAVFCLDPRARGQIAIERFTEAAEQLGYIILCSNNSRNGLDWRTISNIFTDFWADAHARFSIDERRTYAAGFSGGSRLAATFATRCRGCLTGIIGCGAGFPGDIQPEVTTSFSYFGIVGVDDFNFPEMWELEKKLAKLKAPYRFESFTGGHEWPPAANIQRALAWLTLQSMKDGAAARDEVFLTKQFNERMAMANELLRQQRRADSYKAYLSIARDFNELRDTSAALERAEQLRQSTELKNEVKTEEELFRRQLREAGEIQLSWLKQPDSDTASLPRHDASLRLADWRKKKELPDNSPDRRLARRILSQIFIGSIEASQASLRSKDYNVALANLQLAHEVDEKNANVLFELARVFALKREKKSALQSLEEAVSLGFKDAARLKAEDAFATLSQEPRYQKLLSSLASQ
ncbi:MAG TPA: hypothetical protein VLE19_15985 [Pyrinomonadaceae bacterium]|nr:hypothetical protein [Pyrinomonadaceae bacterium]